MSDLRKAAEQAATDLEELVHWHGVRDSNDKLMPAHNQTPEIKSAIETLETLETLRQALAQPEQEPVAKVKVINGDIWGVEWLDKPPPNDIPLYTAPPKREWIGLTEDEIREMIMGMRTKNMGVIMTEEIFREAEAKLKEKNT